MKVRQVAAAAMMSALVFSGCSNTNPLGSAAGGSGSKDWSMMDSATTAGSLVNAFAEVGENLIAGSADGIFVSTDSGTTWSASNAGLPPHPWVNGFAVVGTRVYAATGGDGVFLSTDFGRNWTGANNGLTNPFVESITTDGTNLYAGVLGGLYNTTGGGVFRSTDEGSTWTESITGLGDTNVTALATDGTVVYAGTKTGGVFTSANHGLSWTRASTGLPHEWGIIDIAVAAGRVYTTSEAYGVYVSTNQGEIWSPANVGLPTKYAGSLVVNGMSVYVGTGDGVFVSSDGGYWIPLNSGLGDTLVNGLAILKGCIFAGNSAQAVPVLYRGRLMMPGIWRRPLR